MMKHFPVTVSCEAALVAALLLSAPAGFSSPRPASQDASQAQTGTTQTSVLGSVQSIEGNKLTIKSNAGAVMSVTMAADARVLRIEPGEKSLESAVKIPLSSLAAGDRVLARGTSSNGGRQLTASLLVAIKKADILESQARQREEWQKHGVGGLVKTVDAAAGRVTILRAGQQPLVIQTSPTTVLKRYAPGSIQYNDATPAPIESIHPGDELQARGASSPSSPGGSFDAVEIVSGSFLNITGPVKAVDLSGSSLTIEDLATKHPVEIKISPDTQMKILTPAAAKEIAAELRKPTEAHGNPPAAATSKAPAAMLNPQKILASAPRVPLSDFKKGQAVMLVATEPHGNAASVAVTVIGGVEPMLEASASGSQAILSSSWNLGGSAGNSTGGSSAGGSSSGGGQPEN